MARVSNRDSQRIYIIKLIERTSIAHKWQSGFDIPAWNGHEMLDESHKLSTSSKILG